MLRKSLYIFVFLKLLNLAELVDPCDLGSYPTDPTLIKTKSGFVQGACTQVSINDPDKESRVANVLTWLGVPFAEPPVGPLRFMRTQPGSKWRGIRTAFNFSDICMQSGWHKHMSEDCLYLNIYAPLKQSNKNPLPIYVYIHGGSFQTGSGSKLDPVYAVGLSDIIVVTFNYRLGPFGFMYLGSSSITGNMGFLDQHMALKWVHENARSFNGDPNRITLGGQSAGSFSVHYHVTYPPSWPYFRNVVHQSGSIFTSKRVFISTCEASKRANAIINSLGCLSTMNVPDRLECIQNHTQLESKTLLKAASAYKEQLLGHNEYAATLNPLFPLVQNCHDFNMTVAEYFEKDTHVFKSDMNMIVGYNKDEGGFFLDSDFLENSDQKVKTYTVNYTRFEFFIDNFYYYFPNYPKRMSQTFKKSLMATYTVPKKNDFFQTLIKLLGEHVYICPSVDYVSFYSNFNKSAKVYRYSYDYRSKASLKGQAYGVTHGEQKKIWFGECLDPSVGDSYSYSEKKFSKRLLRYWTNFVKYGDPNQYDEDFQATKNEVWPAWIEGTESKILDVCKAVKTKYNSYLSLHPSNMTVTGDSSFLKCDFWRKYSNYPNLE